MQMCLKENALMNLHKIQSFSMICSKCIGTVHFPMGVPRAAKVLPMGSCLFSSSHQTCMSLNYYVFMFHLSAVFSVELVQ